MAALTWRNVDAPDFSGALNGYRTFSDLLGNAFGGLSQGLDTFDNSISKRVNTNFQLQLAGAQDADAAKAIVSHLATDPNASRISAPTIAMATARPGDLINQALNQENLTNTVYRDNRAKTLNTAEDAAAPLVGDYLAASKNGQGEAWKAAHPGAFGGLSLTAQTALFTGSQDARKNEVGIAGDLLRNTGAQIGNESARFGLTNSQEDRKAQTDADNFIANYRKTGHDGSDLDGAIAGAGLSGKAAMVIYNTLGGGMSGGGSAGGGGAGFSGSGGGGGSSSAAALGMTYGGGQLPDSVQTVGQAADYGPSLVKSKGASPMGLYQINYGTLTDFAPKALGANWRDANFRDPAVQDAIGKEIFASTKGNGAALWDKSANGGQGNGRWAALGKFSQDQINAIAKMPWEQARQYIAQGESGGNPAQLLGVNSLVDQGSKVTGMERNANSIAIPVQAALSGTKSLNETVQGLVGKGGALEGADADFVTRQIQDIQTKAKSGKQSLELNPEAAAVVLSRSARAAQRGTFRDLFVPDKWKDNTLGGNFEVDNATKNDLLGQLTSKDYQKTIITNDADKLRSTQKDAAKALYDAATAKLQSRIMQAQNNPSYDQSLIGQARIEAAQAAARYQAMLGGSAQVYQQQGAFGTPTPQPPAPPPRRVVAQSRPNPSSLMQYYLNQSPVVPTPALLRR